MALLMIACISWYEGKITEEQNIHHCDAWIITKKLDLHESSPLSVSVKRYTALNM